MSAVIDIFVVVFGLIAAAFFAGAETALTAASRARMQALETGGDKRAALANRLIARRGRLISKRVRFFLFEFRSGSPTDHDHEIEEARWLPLAEAVKQLTYPGEREMVAGVLSKTRLDR